MRTDEAVKFTGRDYIEADPSDYGSIAERMIYYPGGMTLWFFAGRTAQIRLDSGWKGSTAGLSIGDSAAKVFRLLGTPWKEDGSSLYYNLHWQGAPVRLRFILGSDGLEEIYLYKVF